MPPARGCTSSGWIFRRKSGSGRRCSGWPRAVRQYGGRYADAATVGELRSASRTIDALEKGWLVQTRTVRNQPIYHYFALFALILLTGAMLLRAIPYFIDVT